MTLKFKRWMLMTVHYTPTQRPNGYAFRLYLKRNQVEVGVGDRGWTVVVVHRSQDVESVTKARLST